MPAVTLGLHGSADPVQRSSAPAWRPELPHRRQAGRRVADAAEHMRFFQPEAIADQLIELQTQVVQLRGAITASDRLPADLIGRSPGSPPPTTWSRVPRRARSRSCCSARPASARRCSRALLHELGRGREQRLRRRQLRLRSRTTCSRRELVRRRARRLSPRADDAREGRFERRRRRDPLPRRDRRPAARQRRNNCCGRAAGEIERLMTTARVQVNVRIVAATNETCASAAREGRFR